MPRSAGELDRTRRFRSIFKTDSAYCGFLVVVLLAVFGQVYAFDSVYYDDATYVFRNPHVHTGLNGPNVLWAFSAGYAANWHPVTWLSHMLDVSLFGLNPAGHHLVSVLFHAINALLLFVVFRRTTGSLLVAAGVSFLFAIHPLRAESVAWIAERKDVLFMFWGMISILFYLRFVESRKPREYLLVLVFLALSLMSKPMLVTFPAVLLLLDFWPLNRMQASSAGFWSVARQLIVEKIPVVALSIGSSVMTLIAQNRGGAISNLSELPVDLRIANAVVAYVQYIGMMLWPSRLVFHHPHRLTNLFSTSFNLCLLALVATTLLFWRIRRRHPYFLMGWIWYLVTMLPVIGLVQVGFQGIADRYTYFTQIGLAIIMIFAFKLLIESTWITRRLLISLSGVLCTLLMVLTFNQVGTWRDLFTLTDHALSVTSHNAKAHYGRGLAYAFRGDDERAVEDFREALRIAPHYDVVRTPLRRAEQRLKRRRSSDAALDGRTSELER